MAAATLQVVKQEKDEVCFDLIKETLRATNLGVRRRRV